jgi:hypothetical protein
MLGDYLARCVGTTEHLQTGTFGCLLLSSIATSANHDATSLTTLLAGGNVEATGITNYARVTGMSTSGCVSRSGRQIKVLPSNVTFNSLGAGGETVIGAVFYKDGANDGARIPIAWINFAASQSLDGTNFVIRWPELAGLLQGFVTE